LFSLKEITRARSMKRTEKYHSKFPRKLLLLCSGKSLDIYTTMIIQGAFWMLFCSAFRNICFVLHGNMNSVKMHYALMKCVDLNQFFT